MMSISAHVSAWNDINRLNGSNTETLSSPVVELTLTDQFPAPFQTPAISWIPSVVDVIESPPQINRCHLLH